MTIGARIKQLQKELGYSSAEKFTETLEKTTVSRLSDVIRGKQKLPDDLMFELITKFNVNSNWIIAGVGDIFIGKIPSIGLEALSGIGICFPILVLITAFSQWIAVGASTVVSIYRGE